MTKFFLSTDNDFKVSLSFLATGIQEIDEQEISLFSSTTSSLILILCMLAVLAFVWRVRYSKVSLEKT